MRKRLKKYEGQRLRFKGTFERFGTRNGRVGVIPTIVLRNVKLCGSRKVLTDHLWFNLTKEFERAELEEWDIVMFDARVERYTKGYKGRDWERQLEAPLEEDLKLKWPTKVVKIKRPEGDGETA